ncbi:MAG TPA: M15 family metallopeptidase [Rhizomicrobium sp.]|nr:M15 family metallopeptidase [Rhizomicrobium sp.]
MPSMTKRCIGWVARSSAAVALLIAGVAQADPLDTLVASYPDKIARRDGNTLIFRDGRHMNAGVVDPDKPFDQLLRNASVREQFLIYYPRDTQITAPIKDYDPGRFRNEAFFDTLYGDCRKGEVSKQLVPVVWLPKHWGHPVMVTRANGVAEHLRTVSAELDALPDTIARAAFPTAGTYVCRPVKDTGRLSMHSYGAAIDLNLKFSNYWLWEAKGSDIPYRNVMPKQIVDIFERHGFIWGGRWYHYDTMHFEYRPELLAASAAPR